MVAVVSPSFRHSITTSVYEDIQSRKSIYHYFLGNILAWDDESAPLETSQSSLFEKDTRNNIVSSKQVQMNDVTYVVPNNIWAAFTTYDMWDDDVSVYRPTATGKTKIEDSTFYVVTEPDYNIYMCIYNNEGVPSTYAPSGRSVNYFETSDGYVWKYLATIPLSLRNKFMTTGFIPVMQSVQNQFYLNGAINSFTIVNGGIGYESTQVSAHIDGDGTGATVSLVLSEAGSITNVVIETSGEGYTFANLIVVKGALDLGSGADISIDLGVGTVDTDQANVELLAEDGALSYIVVEDGGIDYTHANVTVVGNGQSATAEAVIVDGVITRLPIITFGNSYSYASVTIDGDGAGAVGRVILSTKGGHGKDLPAQLMSNTLCFYAFVGNELNQGLLVDNEYRKYGIMRNFKEYASPQKFNSTNGSSCFLVTASTTIGSGILSTDMILNDSLGVKTFRVVSFLDNQVLMHSVDGSVPYISETYRTSLGVDLFEVASVVNPSIDKFSGDLLYIENKTKFIPSETQTIFLRSYIKL